ncbi:hypothetical protein STPH2_1295 [Streptomyces sp. KO7888]|nr:hypothetical protein [Streptomyces sp. KO7888]
MPRRQLPRPCKRGSRPSLSGLERHLPVNHDDCLAVQDDTRRQGHPRHGKIHPGRRHVPTRPRLKSNRLSQPPQNCPVTVELHFIPPARPGRQLRHQLGQGDVDRELHPATLKRRPDRPRAGLLQQAQPRVRPTLRARRNLLTYRVACLLPRRRHLALTRVPAVPRVHRHQAAPVKAPLDQPLRGRQSPLLGLPSLGLATLLVRDPPV